MKQRNDEDSDTLSYKRVNQQKFAAEKKSCSKDNDLSSLKTYTTFTSNNQSRTGSTKVDDLMQMECKTQSNTMEKLFRPYQCYK